MTEANTPKVTLPPEHWDAVFAPSSVASIITTVDSAGRVNAATFGTVTRVAHNPVHILFATMGEPAESDTWRNVRETGQFTINTLAFDNRLLEQARVVGIPFAEGVNELERAGLTEVPALAVQPPRVAECPSHFECEVVWTQPFINRVIVCGIVVAASIDEDCYDAASGTVIWDRLRPAHYAGAAYGGDFVDMHETAWAARPYDGPHDWRPGLQDFAELPDAWPLGYAQRPA